MNHTIGFIGGGNMGGAMMSGLVKTGVCRPEQVTVFDVYAPTLEKLHNDLGINTTDSVEALIEASQVIVLAVKPQVLPAVLEQHGAKITADKLVISIAAGITLERLTGFLSAEHKIVRVMPNTPAMVGEGMAGICPNANVTEEEKAEVLELFNCFGKAELVPEKLIDAVVGVSGSSPAYVYMFIEALADGAVREGMPRPQAYKFAAQAVLGSAKMVLESGMHPGALKDMVCSPAGTTIESVYALEKGGMRAAVMDAVHIAAEKNRNM